MLCQNCGEREARISITQIVNNKKTEIHLCHQCAHQSGQADSVFALQKMLAGMVDWGSDAAGKGKSCPGCGLTEMELRQRGRFGCGQCYQTWAPLVNTIIGRVQGRTAHTGKIPLSAGERARAQREMGELKEKLQAAVREERFEDAAKLRDRIRGLQKD
ncbi:MAG: UvrB/UvrC motif-containing protein [Eubacteriales bacterium]|jgi:protein arginine kinase activator|nr:UvrB/UvrC motif-containing protein [Eubacteriales bacterium]